ncbi:hypothetical protein T4A_9585 [Trichinella pseudospiralis]|uniref:Uncharacterized protein n=1 Tax=Trichinella pseudospiralis TaxID=6337 RepID=A0A0V1DYD9_TRIPS|nr:hypothetical protein T4A_9585 [Trichinella pseudospiralis]
MKSANSPEATNCCSRSARHLRIAISKPRSAFHLVDPSSKLINLINQLPSMDFGPCRAGIVDGKFWTSWQFERRRENSTVTSLHRTTPFGYWAEEVDLPILMRNRSGRTDILTAKSDTKRIDFLCLSSRCFQNRSLYSKRKIKAVLSMLKLFRDIRELAAINISIKEPK